MVSCLIGNAGFSLAVADKFANDLKAELGRLEANAQAANKTGRMAKVGKGNGDAIGIVKFSALKSAKTNVGSLSCRLLTLADALEAFKAAGFESIDYALPTSVASFLKLEEKEINEAAAKAKAAADAKAKHEADKAAVQAERLAAFDAWQYAENAKKEVELAKSAKAVKA